MMIEFEKRARAMRGLARAVVAAALLSCLMPPAFAEAVLFGKNQWLFYAADDMKQAAGDSIHANVALMKDAEQALQAQGIGLVVLVIPLKARFESDHLPDGVSFSTGAQGRYAAMVQALARADIPSVDLMGVLTKVGQDGHDVFFKKDSHWTAWSAEAAAQATATLIGQHWKLPGAAGGGDVLGDWVKERRFSDFTELMTAAQRKSVGQEVYTVRKRPTQQAGLLDEQASVVHVVGNSSVQPYLGFAQMLSHQLDRPVGLTWKYGNYGPWSVFVNYLESADFRQHRPSVIVWQLNEAQLLYGPDVPGQWDASALIPAATWRERVRKAVAP